MRPEVHADTGRLRLPALLVHGGAGTFDRIHEPADVKWLEDGLRQALAAGWAAFGSGGSALDAVIEAVATLEDGGRFNAGRGAVSTSGGSYEFDASVMDGTSGKVGAICAARWPANPIRVARQVAEIGGTPDGPILLAGAGADRFAETNNFPPMTPAMLAGPRISGGELRGTVGAVAVDAAGNVAGGTSTGGRAGQMPGRVGDSPIPGAGIWAKPTTAAISATGAGEAFMVAGFCHLIEWRLQDGASLDEAVGRGLDAVADLGGDGGAISVAPDGTFTAAFNSPAMARGWRDAGGETVALYPQRA